MKNLTIIFLLVLVIPLSSECTRKSDKIIGIKIYEYDKDFKSLVDKWKEMGINTAFVSINLAENIKFRQILKDNNIKVYVIFPVFYNPDLLHNDSTLYAITNKGKIAIDDWVEFVCPSRTAYRAMKVSEAAELVSRLEPDGLSIDFIRQFVFWEMIYPDRTAESIDMACFCDSCTGSFCRLENIAFPDTCLTGTHKANYLLTHHSDTWSNYRCDLIASMVQEIAAKVRDIQPGIKINVHIVPWRDSDFGGANIRVAAQDLQKIAPVVDYISPMCYSQMLKLDADWIASVVTSMDKKAPGKVLPSIQVYPYYIDDPFTIEDFSECTEKASEDPSLGVVFFSWPLFEKDTVRMNIRN